MANKKPAAMKTRSFRETMLAIDSRYFDYCDDEDGGYRVANSEEDAAYHLATWLFDQDFMREDSETIRKRLKRYCSPSLYLLTLEYFIDGRHDT